MDKESLELFARKGTPSSRQRPPETNLNGLKVRRILQWMSDLPGVPLSQLRVLDLACGEGVYAIEAACHGAAVVAIDGRTERMEEGRRAAARLGLAKLRFEQGDVRQVTRDTHGTFDVVMFLGILYHLDRNHILPVLKNLRGLCTRMLLIDTHIALNASDHFMIDGRRYEGREVREHSEADAPEVRLSRQQLSLDDPLSFWLTRDSLCRLLREAGFTSVAECQVPLEPLKPINRITLAAVPGNPKEIATYPWINGATEEELLERCREEVRQSMIPQGHFKTRLKQTAKRVANGVLGRFGLEIRRL